MNQYLNPKRILLRHPAGLELDLMDVGATWLSCRVPMRGENVREVILGCHEPEGYANQNAYLGAMIGRYANRIANGRFSRNGINYILEKEANARHQLHGGPAGFDRRAWSIVSQTATSVCLQLISPDGDQGFPGRLTVTLTVSLSGARQITLDMQATSDADSPVSITHHAYFNLNQKQDDGRTHLLEIAADSFLPIDESLIPLGELVALENNIEACDFDFRQPKCVAADWLGSAQQKLAAGYDHAYLLGSYKDDVPRPAAKLWSASRDLKMTVTTDMPALHLYTGQFLDGIVGRDGAPYAACAGIALEPEFLPDSPNHPEWPQPTCWLSAGKVYHHTIRYDFDVL